jgi:hypothetical protein
MPWVNDLSVERENNAAAHVQELTAFVDTLTAPDRSILILTHYYGDRAEFVQRYSAGYTHENITVFNDALFAACEQGLNAHCIQTEPLFAGMGQEHLIMGGTRAEIEPILYEPIAPDILPYFEAFWNASPDGSLQGDGVHLSELGKQILAAALVQELLVLEPDL